MYILMTLEFPTHNFDFHLLTASVNAKYYYCNAYYVLLKIIIFTENLKKMRNKTAQNLLSRPSY